MANKFACGLILFAVLIALSFGVVYAEKTVPTGMNKTSMNKTNVTMNKTNVTMPKTTTAAPKTTPAPTKPAPNK